MEVTLYDASRPEPAVATESHAQHSRVLLWLWGLFCALMLVVAMRDYYRGGGSRWWQPVLWEGSSMIFATGLLALQRRAARRYAALIDRPARWFAQHLKWLPLAVLAFLLLVYGTRHGVYALLGESYRHEPWLFVVWYESVKLSLFICLWLGVIFSFDSYAFWQKQQQRVLLLQRSLAEARLSQLSAQLRPHFFFNVLNTISALMHLDVARADRLLARLGDLLRGSLESAEHEVVPLREEIRLLELYAQVMLERFADRVTVEWNVAEDTLDVPVPALLLQPLLENAFKHGVEQTRGRVSIEIAAQRQGEKLTMTLRNTGPDLTPHGREGVGLRNSRERLDVLYGGSASLRLTVAANMAETRVSIPWRQDRK